MKGKPILKGELGFLGLPDLLQIVGQSNKTGTLRITSKHAPKAGLIFFIYGNPVNAISGKLNGLDAIYSLFGWTEGNFELHEEEVRVEQVVDKSIIQIILDGLRMLDEGSVKTIGPSIKEKKPALGTKDREDKKPALRTQDREEDFFVVKGPQVDYVYIVDEEHFSDGAEIFKEGAHGNWIWVILGGMVEISKNTKKGPMTVVRLGEGCFLGTFGCLSHGLNRRSATVTAIGKVSLGLLDSEHLSRDFASISPDFKSLLLSLDNRLRKITDRTVDLFLKKQEIDGFIEGENLIPEQGALAENAFYIKKGEVYVTKRTSSGDLPLMTLEKNDVFGYVPFMNISPELPFTSLLGSNELELGNFDPKILKKEYDQLPGTLKNLIYYVSSNVSATTKFAINLQGRVIPY
jgi:CRP-like cAMP-binding protein